jgi:pimeloyl-ACP methyl ester carboxylesterase
MKWIIDEYLLIIKTRLYIYFTSPPAEWKKGKLGDVILMHGWNGIWQYYKPLASYLNRIGYRVHVLPELGNNHFPIIRGVKILEQYLASQKIEKLTLIGHSKGGLIAAQYFKNNPEKVERIITIATPWGGSMFGYGRFLGLSELKPNSDVINRIINKLNVKMINNLFPFKDNHVIPNGHLVLPGAINIQIPVNGHTMILNSSDTYECIFKILKND